MLRCLFSGCLLIGFHHRFPFCCLYLFRRLYVYLYKKLGVVCMCSHLPRPHARDSMSLCLFLNRAQHPEGSPLPVRSAPPFTCVGRSGVGVSHPCCVSCLRWRPDHYCSVASGSGGPASI